MVGHRDIPKKLRWLFVSGLIGTWIIILYPVVFLFYPNVVNNTFSIPIPIIRSFTGILFIIMGSIVEIISGLQLGLSTRFYLPAQKTKLITSGVYSFCRNPLYIGVHLSFLGIFFLLPSLIYLIGLFLFLINQHLRILQEEKFLTESFGAEYEKYLRRTGRYLPIEAIGWK